MEKNTPDTPVIPLIDFDTINPDRKPLTTERLKTYSGFGHLTETELTEQLCVIKSLARLLLKYVLWQESQHSSQSEEASFANAA